MIFKTLLIQAAFGFTMVAAKARATFIKIHEDSFVPASLGGKHHPYVDVDVDKKGMTESLYPEPRFLYTDPTSEPTPEPSPEPRYVIL